MSRSLPVLLVLLAACADRPAGDARDLRPSRDSADSAFTLVQARGQVAMGVDQYTSAHHFEPLVAIHEFLAFQRHDHRAGGGPAH